MHKLARYLTQTLRWRPNLLIDAKVDAWRLALPRERTEEAKKMATLTYHDLVGNNCDDVALKCSFAEPRYLLECGDIRVSEKCPPARRWGKRQETPVALALRKTNFCLRGSWGVGKSHQINEIAAALRAKGQHVYICLLYTSPSPRDATLSRMPSSA